MGEHHTLTRRTLVVASLAYLLAGVASAAAQTAAVFSDDIDNLTGSLPLVLSIGATPVVAAIVRRQPVRRSLTVTLLIMLVAVAFQPVAGNRFALELLLGVVFTGQLILGAVLLVLAWRASSITKAMLAGVFVLPQVLNQAVLLEVLRFEDMADQGRLVLLGIVLLVIGLLASTGIPLEESEGPTLNERSLDRTTIIGGALALGASAALVNRADSLDNGLAAPVAGLALLAAFVLIGVFRQQQTGTGPAVHIDGASLIFAAVASVLIVWVEFASQFFGGGLLSFGGNTPIVFDNVVGWRRAVALFLVLTTIPLVTAVGQGGRRLMAGGALAGAIAAVVWVVFVLSDLELGLFEFIAFGLLIDIARLIVLGGTVVFMLRRIDDASIEAGLVILLAALPLLSIFANQVAFELVGVDLVFSNFNDTDNLRLFIAASAVGLVWMAAWWALRPDRSREPEPVLVDQTSSP